MPTPWSKRLFHETCRILLLSLARVGRELTKPLPRRKADVVVSSVSCQHPCLPSAAQRTMSFRQITSPPHAACRMEFFEGESHCLIACDFFFFMRGGRFFFGLAQHALLPVQSPEVASNASPGRTPERATATPRGGEQRRCTRNAPFPPRKGSGNRLRYSRLAPSLGPGVRTNDHKEWERRQLPDTYSPSGVLGFCGTGRSSTRVSWCSPAGSWPVSLMPAC